MKHFAFGFATACLLVLSFLVGIPWGFVPLVMAGLITAGMVAR